MDRDTAWESKTREELLQMLYEMLETAPRGAAEAWLQESLLPMLERKRQEGGMRESA